MKNLKRRVSFIVLVVVIAGTMTSLIRVEGSSNFQGTVENNEGTPQSGVVVTLFDYYLTILGSDTTDSSGDYDFDATLNGNSPYLLAASKTRFTAGMKWITGGGTNDFELEGIAEKIAVFFWASDAGLGTIIDDYIEILDGEGYATFFEFEDSSNVAADCATVDKYELDVDTVFVYVIGHGENTGGHSYTNFKPSGSYTGSHTFRGYMDLWDAPRKSLLVESCEAGDWADDFAASPYLAMATSDESHSAYTYQGHATPWEGDFSHWFFYAIDILGDNAVDAFDYASGEITETQNPKIQDYSSYEWFD